MRAFNQFLGGVSEKFVENTRNEQIQLLNKYGIILNNNIDQDMQIEAGLKKITQMNFGAIFSTIFHKEILTNDQMYSLWNEYLGDNSISREKDLDGKSVFKINSMIPIINYLKNHPQVSTCNFVPFKSNVSDVSTLSAYLATPGCKVRAVGVSNEISQDAKNSLATVSAVRNQFRVVYK